MKQIVCLSTANWYPFPTRKQQVMSRIKDVEVLYFDPSFTILAPLKDKKLFKSIFNYKKEQPQPQENIKVFSMPPVLPFFNRFRFINKINQKRIAKFVNKKIKENGFDNPLLWVYSPTTCDCVDYIKNSGLVYDCVDRHSAYGGQMNPQVVDNMELDLAKKCDVVFATAKSLAERLKTANKNTYFIPNGANYERFSIASKPQEVPNDIKDLKHPIFGFIGALQSCICYEYIEYAAKLRPDWNFVMIGHKLPEVDISSISSLPNVHLLGLRPNEELPKYIAQFDACLNLFVSNNLSKDVSPLKFFEYLATGKPIISTPQPEQVMDYKDCIFVAPTKEEFVNCLEKSLEDTTIERKELRMKYGKECSWDSRVLQMLDTLSKNNIN